jgi:hypothetical protein
VQLRNHSIANICNHSVAQNLFSKNIYVTLKLQIEQPMQSMKILALSIMLLAVSTLVATAQINPGWKAEIGYLNFQNQSLRVDPGPNWKGYYLNNDPNGIDLNIAYGINFRNRLYAGIGLGLLSFEDIQGGDAFAVIDYSLLKTSFAPFLHFRSGYSHIWNQYEGGRGTAITEIGGGLKLRISPKFAVSLRSGIMLTQQTFFIPVVAGFNF